VASVLITVLNTGWVHKSVCESVQRIISDPRHTKTLLWPALAPPLYNAMNQVAKMFRDGEWDYLLHIDDDNAPIKNPLDLIDLELDFVALPTPIWKPTDEPALKWNIFKRTEHGTQNWPDPSGLQRVELAGSGCFLVARRVFEHPDMQNPWFPCYSQEGIRMIGPDMAFCLRAAKAGFGIHAHFDYTCTHVKELDLADLMAIPNVVPQS